MPHEFMPHVQWIVDKQGAQLVACVEAQLDRGADTQSGLRHTGVDAPTIVGALSAADPSPGQHAVQWLANTLMAGGYRWEDLAGRATSKVYETLTWFAQCRASLPLGQRKLESHTSLSSVYTCVRPFLDAVDAVDSATGSQVESSGRALRRSVREGALEHSLVLHKSSELIVAVPLTQAASQWWGRGTRWCTAAENNNMFDSYNRKSPLIVVCMPGIVGGKLQLWLDGNGRVQFMDSSDYPVSSNFIEQNWIVLEALMSWAMEREPAMMRYMPPSSLDRQTCLAGLELDPTLLAHVPSHLLDHDMCLDAVSRSGLTLARVPQHMRTAQICHEAMRSNPRAWRHVPHHLLSHDMRMQILEIDGHNIKHMDQSDPRELAAAIAQNPHALGDIALQLRTSRLCIAAVEQNAMAIMHVPDSMKSTALFEAMLRVDGCNLMWVGDENTTHELCLIALYSNPRAMLQVPVLTEEYARIGVRGDGSLLGDVYDCFRTPEICRIALQNYPGALKYIPLDILDMDMCMSAVSRDGMVLDAVPQRWRTMELCTLAIGQNMQAFRYVPMHWRDYEMSLAAVAHVTSRGSHKPLLECVAPHLRTPELVRTALKANGMALMALSPEDRTGELCELAFKSDVACIRFVPRPLQGVHMWVEAALEDAALMRHVDFAALPTGTLRQMVSMAPVLLFLVPANLRTVELCDIACEANPQLVGIAHAHLVETTGSGELAGIAKPVQWSPDIALAGLAEALAAGRPGRPCRDSNPCHPA